MNCKAGASISMGAFLKRKNVLWYTCKETKSIRITLHPNRSRFTSGQDAGTQKNEVSAGQHGYHNLGGMYDV